MPRAWAELGEGQLWKRKGIPAALAELSFKDQMPQHFLAKFLNFIL